MKSIVKSKKKPTKGDDAKNEGPQPKRQDIFFEDVKEAITGYARIIKYFNHSAIPNENEETENSQFNMNPESLELVQVEEG